MSDHTPAFDLVLSYPQWQGSGRPHHLRRGAYAAAEVCGRYGPLAQVPEAGEGEARDGINRWTAVLEQFRSARAILAERQPRRLLVAGGDCGCDVAVIDYLLEKYPDLTVIWIDAHLDANTAATTPSGNFHGMPVAAILGSPPAGLAPLLGKPLSAARFRYVSAHLGDDGDWAFQKANGVSWLQPGESVSGPIHVSTNRGQSSLPISGSGSLLEDRPDTVFVDAHEAWAPERGRRTLKAHRD